MQADELARIISIVQRVAQRLVSDGDALRVFLKHDGETIQVHVSQRDLGKIIGKQGRTAQAIRVIVDGIAMKMGGRIRVDISVVPMRGTV